MQGSVAVGILHIAVTGGGRNQSLYRLIMPICCSIVQCCGSILCLRTLIPVQFAVDYAQEEKDVNIPTKVVLLVTQPATLRTGQGSQN